MELITSCQYVGSRCRERGSIYTREVDRGRRWRKVLALWPFKEEATLLSSRCWHGNILVPNLHAGRILSTESCSRRTEVGHS